MTKWLSPIIVIIIIPLLLSLHSSVRGRKSSLAQWVSLPLHMLVNKMFCSGKQEAHCQVHVQVQLKISDVTMIDTMALMTCLLKTFITVQILQVIQAAK